MDITRDEQGKWHWKPTEGFYDVICDGIRNASPFSFARYGDGEFNAIYGKKGANCDGHTYFKDMGERLGDIVATRKGYFFGLQPLALQQRPELLDIRDDWVNADVLHNANIDERLENFLDALRGEIVLFVGPDFLHQYAERHDWHVLDIPAKNCWLRYPETLRHLINIGKEYDVILYCASMMANVLIDDMYGYIGQEVIQVDAGSIFDVHAGKPSRSYHYKML